jgi:hypothetical protein
MEDTVIVGVFSSDKKVTDNYLDIMSWFDHQSSLNPKSLDKKYSFEIISKIPNKEINFRILNLSAPGLNQIVRNSKIILDPQSIGVKIRIEIPLPRSASPPVSYPIFLHDYMYHICEGILDKLSPEDIATIYPQQVLNDVIKSKEKRKYIIIFISLIPFLASLRYLLIGELWVFFYLSLFSILFTFYFINLINNQITKYSRLLKTLYFIDVQKC